MAKLAGKLIASPIPRAGFWVHRRLRDGTLLETQLTEKEWLAVLHADTAERNKQIAKLNRRPLNLAAMELLRRAKAGPGNPGSLEWVHILSLAALGLRDDDGNFDDEEGLRFAAWTRNERTMAGALGRLEDAKMSPEDLLKLKPLVAARSILEELGVI
jgi:hypothetical protein